MSLTLPTMVTLVSRCSSTMRICTSPAIHQKKQPTHPNRSSSKMRMFFRITLDILLLNSVFRTDIYFSAHWYSKPKFNNYLQLFMTSVQSHIFDGFTKSICKIITDWYKTSLTITAFGNPECFWGWYDRSSWRSGTIFR